MDTPFTEASAILTAQKLQLAKIMKEASYIGLPRDHFMRVQVNRVKGDESAQDIYNRVSIESALNQALFNNELVAGCLNLMRLTLNVVEAQQALAISETDPQTDDLIACYGLDMKAFIALGVVVKTFVDAPPVELPQETAENWQAETSRLFKDLEPLAMERFAENQFRTKPALIDLIYLQRMKIVEACEDIADSMLSQAEEHVDNALILKTAWDLGILQADAEPKEISEWAEQAEEKIDSSSRFIHAREQFLSNLYECGEYSGPKSEFKPVRYLPITMFTMALQIP